MVESVYRREKIRERGDGAFGTSQSLIIRQEQEWKNVSVEVFCNSCTLYFLICFLGIFSGDHLAVSFSLRFCFLPYIRVRASLLDRLFLWSSYLVLPLCCTVGRHF